MLKNALEEVEDISLAVVLEGRWPRVFHSSACIVLLAKLSLQTSAKLQVLTVACWLDFRKVDVGKCCAGAKAKEKD